MTCAGARRATSKRWFLCCTAAAEATALADGLRWSFIVLTGKHQEAITLPAVLLPHEIQMVITVRWLLLQPQCNIALDKMDYAVIAATIG